jgi:hypothetical protein
VTVVQFIAGFGLFAMAIAGSIGVAVGATSALYIVAGIAVVALLWGVFNTWELIFRMQAVGS